MITISIQKAGITELEVDAIVNSSNKVRKASGTVSHSMRVECFHSKFITTNTPGYIEECHRAGIRCNVWTPNSRKEFELLLNLGVDGIITNYPDHAMAARAELQKQD